MKTLLLIRHAKSSWKNTSLTDHERPLNKRGLENLERMAKRLTKQQLQLDAFLSSDAKRARTTAEALTSVLPSRSPLTLNSELYCFSKEELIQSIVEIPDTINNLALVGHNPALEELVDWLCPTPPEHFPTLAVANLTLAITRWRDLQAQCGELIYFDYPKKLEE